MKRHIRRILIGLTLLVAVIAIAGGVYESVARRRAAAPHASFRRRASSSTAATW